MSSEPTIIEKNASCQPPTDPSPATIIERNVSCDTGSVASIRENRGAASGPFLNLVPGAEFREYRLVHPLKVSSAEADLWLIERRAEARQFVLKLYRYGIHPKAEILEALRGLRREHVVEIVEAGEQDGRSYEIQEFVSNGSLADVIQRGAVPENLARDILSELTDSLAHLHAARVLHRDIKPSNILVRSLAPVDLILTDFGISSLSDGALHLTNVNRTAAYGAPEALTGVLATASDWWSVGVIVIELLSGGHPFAGLSEQAVNFQLVSKGIPVPQAIAPSWRPLVKGLLTRDHVMRWGAEQIRGWLAGRRDIPVHLDSDAAPAIPATRRRPYKFDNQEFLEPRELAAALAQNWSEAVKHCGRGTIHSWAELGLGDPPLAAALQDLSLDYQLSPDQKLALTLLLLHPELPLIFKGQIVDLNWCQQNATDAFALAKSPLPAWLKKLKKDCCLEPWVAQRDARKNELDQFGLPLDPTVVERLLSAPEISVVSAAHEQRALFAAAKLAKLEVLRQQAELTFTEAIVLLACDRGAWVTAPQKPHWDKLERLKSFGVDLDWPLAEKLLAAEDREILRPMWEEYLALWRRRRRSCLPLSHPRFPAILENPAPEYLDAVAVVANRLDFVNSLGLRFVSLPGSGVLFSAWTTRLQDYNAFAQATSRTWKPPSFPQAPLHPIVNVSWEDATAFCAWLTEKERREGRLGQADEYRLPYDLEWSHAIGLEDEGGHLPIDRAGKVKGIYPWGSQWPPPPNVANIGGALRCDSFTHTAPVGSFAPNCHGIFDLGSNVSEWCWDWYDSNQQMKTLRGASWFQSTPEHLWSSVRRFFVPGARSDSIGFRCVLLMRSFVAPGGQRTGSAIRP